MGNGFFNTAFCNRIVGNNCDQQYYSNNYIYIPVKNNNLGFADLKIFTVGLDLIYEGKESIIAGEKIVVRWDGRDSNGNKMPTGVYIYATNSDDDILTGKFVIYNE